MWMWRGLTCRSRGVEIACRWRWSSWKGNGQDGPAIPSATTRLGGAEESCTDSRVDSAAPPGRNTTRTSLSTGSARAKRPRSTRGYSPSPRWGEASALGGALVPFFFPGMEVPEEGASPSSGIGDPLAVAVDGLRALSCLLLLLPRAWMGRRKARMWPSKGWMEQEKGSNATIEGSNTTVEGPNRPVDNSPSCRRRT